MPAKLAKQFSQAVIHNNNSKVQLYDGTLVEVSHSMSLYCQRNNKCYYLKFRVLDVPYRYPLISGDDAVQLGLVDIHADEVNIVKDVSYQPLTQADVLERFSEVFTGLGTIGEPYGFDIDPDIKPIQSPPRSRYPISSRQKLTSTFRTFKVMWTNSQQK